MPAICSICSDERREAIDAALLAGEPHRRVAAQFSVARSSLGRHRANHHLAGVEAAAAEADVAEEHGIAGVEDAVEHEDEVDPAGSGGAFEVQANCTYMVGSCMVQLKAGQVLTDLWTIQQAKSNGAKLRACQAPEIPLWLRHQPAPPPQAPKPVPIKLEAIPSSLDEAERILRIDTYALDRALGIFQQEAGALARRGAPQRQLQAMTTGVRDALARAEQPLRLIIARGGINALREFGLTEATWAAANFNEAQQIAFAAAAPPPAFDPRGILGNWASRGISVRINGPGRLLIGPRQLLNATDHAILANQDHVLQIEAVLNDVLVIERGAGLGVPVHPIARV